MKTSVNIKRILVILLGTIVSGVCVHFLHGYQVRRNAGGLYERAIVLEKEGQKAQATDLLGQYLGMVPGDNEALAHYGLLLEAQAKTPRALLAAYLVLNQVVRRDETRQDISLRAAKTAIKLGRYGDAKEHLQVLFKASPEEIELLHLNGLCEEGLRNYDKAAEFFHKAIVKDASQLDIFLDYAVLLRERLNSATAADEAIDQMVGRNVGSLPARLKAAGYFVRFGMPQKAWTHLRVALDEPGQPSDELLLLAGQVALTRGEVEEARKLFQQGLQLYPRDPRMSRGLARVEIRKGELGEALSLLKQSLQAIPKEPEELWSLANLLIDAGAIDQARGVVGELAKTAAPGWVDFLEARFLMRKGSWGEAGRLLEKVRGDSRLPPLLLRNTNFLLAEFYERSLNPDQRFEALRRAVDLDPSWLPARHGLALALAELRKLDPAIAELRHLAAVVPDARLDLARLLVQRNRRLPGAQRDWSEVEGLLGGRNSRDPAAAVLLQVEVLALQGKLEQACKLAQAERDRQPDQVAPWLALIALEEAKEGSKPEAISRLIDEAKRGTGKQVEWLLLRAQAWLRAGAATGREQLPKLRAELDHFKGKDRQRLLSGLAEAYVAAGDLPAARRSWLDLAELDPDNLSVWLLLFDGALEAKEEAEAGRILKQIKRLDGAEGPHTACCEAAVRIVRAGPAKEGNGKADKQALAEARLFLGKAAALRPSWGRVPLLQATIAELEGNKVEALEKLKAALERGEGRFPVVRRALELMYEQRLLSDAGALLRRLPEQALAGGELGRLAAQVTLLQGEREAGQDLKAARREALALARKAVATDSKDHRDYMWLGQIAALADELTEAEQALRRACELNGKTPETWVALVHFLAARDVKKAEGAMAEAKKHLPADELPLALAVHQELLGRLKEAEEQYLAALAARPEDPTLLRNLAAFHFRYGELAKAETFLRKLLRPDPGASNGAASWARRHLALALAFQGSYSQFKEAQTLLEKNRNTDTESLEDAQIKAMVLASRSAHRREAIQLLESLGGPPTNEVRFLLAQLHEADGNWRAAEGHLLVLLAGEEKNPVHVARYARGLVRAGRAEEAQLDLLLKAAPDTLETLDLRILVLKARGQSAEAATLVKAYAQGKDARLDLTARWFDFLGQAKDAEQAYRAWMAAAKEPEVALELARYLGRSGRLPEALEICERAWQACAPEAVAATCIDVLRTGKGGPTEQDRVEKWLRTAITKHAQSKLPVFLAELHQQRGQMNEAVSIYRAFLRQGASDPVAQNNLAFLLAITDGDADEALRLINAAIDILGPVADLLDTRAVIHLKGKRAQLAVQDLQQAIAEAPAPSFYFHLALAHEVAQNRVEASRALRQARDLGLKASDLLPPEQAGLRRLTHWLSTETTSR